MAERISSAPRHQQFIMTLYGLYARQEGDALPVSALVRLLGELGVEPAGVRSSVSRLKRRGVLESRRHGGAATYAISPQSLHIFAEGDARIYAPPRAQLEDKWLLAVFSIPETMRAKRHTLRSELIRLGFGSVTSGVWIAPAKVREQVQAQLRQHGLDAYVDFFVADHQSPEELRAKVSQWWDLDALVELYAGFVRRYQPVLKRWRRKTDEAGGGTGNEGFSDADLAAAFAVYVAMFTEWRRLPYLDPGLPLELLPDEWKGQEAEALFADLHQLLGPLAERHARSVIRQS
ncbi:MAG TPA: PaaX family transcriptional regulator C-terminal domain-containing protein [Micrococcaceae bacterium]|jgi:phenylacetic acid degradation operon negative regulatory protein|nr:PaaX family transcriptional regulator C-terminal domain-containing protein [Micrococcaceae bacterium]